MSESWSYIQNGNTLGPVSEETLRDLLSTGLLSWDDLVWHQGLADWTKASKFPELLPARIPLAEPPQAPAPMAPRPIVVRGEDPFAKVAMAGALEALRATKPWVRFLGVLGIIGTIFTGAGALVIAGMSRSPLLNMPAPLGMVLPVFYLLMLGLQLPPVIFLNRYASRIGTLLASESPQDLAEALNAQKSFWRYVGILALIFLCLEALFFVVGIGAAVVLGSHHRF